MSVVWEVVAALWSLVTGAGRGLLLVLFTQGWLSVLFWLAVAVLAGLAALDRRRHAVPTEDEGDVGEDWPMSHGAERLDRRQQPRSRAER